MGLDIPAILLFFHGCQAQKKGGNSVFEVVLWFHVCDWALQKMEGETSYEECGLI